MTFQTACGLCQGQLLVETPGMVVECPHCGAHLASPEEPAAGEPQPTAFPPKSASDGDDGSVNAGLNADTNASAADGAKVADDDAADKAVEGSSASVDETASPAAETPPVWMPPSEDAQPEFDAQQNKSASPRASVYGTWEPGQAPGFDDEHDDTAALAFDPQFGSAAEPEPATALNFAEPSVGTAQPGDELSPSAAAIATEQVVHTRTAKKSQSADQTAGVSRGVFVAVLSYASAVTLALIYLLIRMSQPNPHQLESLPDLPPPESNAFHHIREDAQMAPHHTLRIGESRRFGNVVVTPLRVTREPLQLVHYNDPGKSKSTSAPVLKLWLEFENQSQDQTFSPLDLELMLRQEYDQENPERVLSNNFVCRASDKVRGGRLVHVYPLNPLDRWDLKDHTAGRELQPGEKKVVYIPTGEDGVSHLSGDLVWRVHFRKGLNPNSGRGVTTVIEVVFHSDEISASKQEKPQHRETSFTALR
jgi:hypothetical protein